MYSFYKKTDYDKIYLYADLQDVEYYWINRPTKESLKETVKYLCPNIEETLAIQLLDYLYYLVSKEEYVDNERICNVRDTEQYNNYIQKMKRGCCGQTDETVFVYDEENDTYEIYMVGCNYGH